MQSIRIGIVEDELDAAKLLESFLYRLGEEEGFRFSIAAYSSAVEFLETYKCEYDILFFDIQMPGIDGMDAATELRKIDGSVKLVFVTSLAQYAIRGYSVSASDYILKPLHYGDLKVKLQRLFASMDQSHPLLTLKRGGNLFRVPYDEISYIESSLHRIYYHTKQGDFDIFSTIKSIEQGLDPEIFIKINSGYIVNINYVKGVEESDCVLLDGTKLRISRSKLAEFRKLLHQN